MSTRSIIAVAVNGKIKSVSCQHDGYPDYTGKILAENYNCSELAESLVNLGDLSQIGKRIAPADGEAHSFNQPAAGVTIAYHRDRGEDYFAPAEFTSEVDFIKDIKLSEADFIYLFENGVWFYSRRRKLEWKQL